MLSRDFLTEMTKTTVSLAVLKGGKLDGVKSAEQDRSGARPRLRSEDGDFGH